MLCLSFVYKAYLTFHLTCQFIILVTHQSWNYSGYNPMNIPSYDIHPKPKLKEIRVDPLTLEWLIGSLPLVSSPQTY
ncbi:hypothetical protein VNO78_14573 [Psophocarpus tetragonolobus]|uniref:Uncharacterized protein n=1 Tax=Psophocarpus tetragonolobus TaxID=3891 RepID=A0AAN9XQK8_PSOTE